MPSDNLDALFQQAYDAGARVKSDSWGWSGDHYYDGYAEQVDEFAWTHKDMTIIFSNGNDGTDANGNGVVDLGSVDLPATAKDDISVGASQSFRPHSEGWGGYANKTYNQEYGNRFPVAPIASGYMSDKIDGMAALAAAGPRRTAGSSPIWWPRARTSSRTSRRCRERAAGCGATMMPITPMTVGRAWRRPSWPARSALVREAYQNATGVAPSAALVKAALLAGADDLNPGQYGYGSTREIGPTAEQRRGLGPRGLEEHAGHPDPHGHLLRRLSRAA